jgi:hypothetical protein
MDTILLGPAPLESLSQFDPPPGRGRGRAVAVLAAAGLLAGAALWSNHSWEKPQPPPAPITADADSAWAAHAQATLASVEQQIKLVDQTRDDWQRLPEPVRAQPSAALSHLVQRRAELEQQRGELASSLATYRTTLGLQQRVEDSTSQLRTLQQRLEQPAAPGAEQNTDPGMTQRLRGELAEQQQGRAAAEQALAAARAALAAAKSNAIPDDQAATSTTVDAVKDLIDHPAASPAQAPDEPGRTLPSLGEPERPPANSPADATNAVLSPTGPPVMGGPTAEPPAAPVPAAPAPRLGGQAPTPQLGPPPVIGDSSGPSAAAATPRPQLPARATQAPRGDTHGSGNVNTPRHATTTPPRVPGSDASAGPGITRPQLPPAAPSGRPQTAPAQAGFGVTPQSVAPDATTGPGGTGSGPIVVFEDPQSQQRPAPAMPAPATAPQYLPEQRADPAPAAASPGSMPSEADVERITGSRDVARMSQTPEGQEIMKELFGNSSDN